MHGIFFAIICLKMKLLIDMCTVFKNLKTNAEVCKYSLGETHTEHKNYISAVHDCVAAII